MVTAGTSEPPVENKEDLASQRLSEQLLLDKLWDTLGECLSELARTSDHHAVLVLQPAVEAFFIVHAGEKDNKQKEPAQQRGEDQLSHINMDMAAPPSPATQSTSDASGALTRENSVMSMSQVSSNLPPDTQRFLKFAGMSVYNIQVGMVE